MNPMQVVQNVVAKLSPEMQVAIANALTALQAEAAKTKSPADDIALAMFRMLTGL